MKSLRIGHRKHAPDSTLPLINIVLLLVLAFMIAGVIEAPLPDGFDPLQANSEPSETSATPPVVLIVTQTGDVFLDGQRIESADVQALLASEDKTERELSVKADSRAPAASVIDLLADAEDAGFTKAVVMTIGSDK